MGIHHDFVLAGTFGTPDGYYDQGKITDFDRGEDGYSFADDADFSAIPQTLFTTSATSQFVELKPNTAYRLHATQDCHVGVMSVGTGYSATTNDAILLAEQPEIFVTGKTKIYLHFLQRTTAGELRINEQSMSPEWITRRSKARV